jgi:hypothetical protein
MFGQTVFHGGDDLVGKRDLRIYRRSFLAVPLICQEWWGSIVCARRLSLRAISKHGKHGSTSRGAVADHVASPTGNGLRLMPDD